MSYFNFDISPELEKTINKLVKSTNCNSQSELFRRAIALMKIAAEAQAKGEKILITDKNRNPQVELQIY